MKNLFSFLTFIFFAVFQAQELKDFIIPKGYTKINEVKGDLDKDGKDETIVVFNTDKKIESDFNNSYQREFFIIKNINGKLKIWQKNSTIIYASETGFYPEDNNLDIIIRNNCLIISQSFFSNSRHTDTSKYTFRFQNGDFYLIGALSRLDDTCEYNFSNEVNFSTGKVIIDEAYSECDGNENRKIPKDYHKEFIHKFNLLIKMNDFRIGENKFKIPNSNKYFNY